MPVRAAVLPVIRSVVASAIGAMNVLRRLVYSFDGVDDHAVLTYRAINPDGDNSFEFWSPAAFVGEQAIITQCQTSNASLMEFRIFARSTPDLVLTFGGSVNIFFNTAQGLKPSTRYGLTLIGNNLQVFEGGLGGALVRSTTFTRGTAREPAAPTLVSARNNNGPFTNFFAGRQYDVKINGVLWPMQDRNQTIQLPSPSGLGAELVSNPSSSELGSWAYSGGTLSASAATAFSVSMAFPVSVIAGQQYLVEYEITSMTGSVRPRLSGGANVNGTTEATIGIKRLLVTAVTGNNALLFQAIAEGTSLSIKNISFKPLGTCNPMTMVNTTSDRWQEISQ